MRFFVSFVHVAGVLFLVEQANSLNSGYISSRLHPPTLHDKSYKWKHSVLLYRHTLRSPLKYSSANTIVTPDQFPRGTGYATERGLNLAYMTGLSWRQRYRKLLQDRNPRHAFARASHVDRCFETTHAVTKALFENNGFDRSVVNPIPIINAPDDQDKYVHLCGQPIPADWSSTYNITGVPGGKFANIGELMNFVKKTVNAPANLSDLELYAYYLDAFVCAKWNGNKLPKWVEDNFEAIEWVHGRVMGADTPLGSMNVFFGYYLMQGMADRIEQVVKSGFSDEKVGSRISFFGYHDKSVQAVVNGISDQYNDFIPNFLGTLFLDLFVNQKNASDVQVLVGLSPGLVDVPRRRSSWYEHVTFGDIKPVKLSNCSNPCPVSKLLEIFRAAYADEIKQYDCGDTGNKSMV